MDVYYEPDDGQLNQNTCKEKLYNLINCILCCDDWTAYQCNTIHNMVLVQYLINITSEYIILVHSIAQSCKIYSLKACNVAFIYLLLLKLRTIKILMMWN